MHKHSRIKITQATNLSRNNKKIYHHAIGGHGRRLFIKNKKHFIRKTFHKRHEKYVTHNINIIGCEPQIRFAIASKAFAIAPGSYC